MALFRFYWVKDLIRRHTKPIAVDKAILWKQRLTYAYVFLGWNCLAYVIYVALKGKADWAQYHGLKSEEELRLTPAQQWAKTLGIKKATVYRITGFNVEKYEIDDTKTVQE